MLAWGVVLLIGVIGLLTALTAAPDPCTSPPAPQCHPPVLPPDVCNNIIIFGYYLAVVVICAIVYMATKDRSFISIITLVIGHGIGAHAPRRRR